uniref:Uncharacterized protein n=1 Tax=Tetraselmis sp. GSL018 TaxID=582737 RepID=A0A061RJ49_9CHLO|mmetsp:Transcript_38170/g.90634  ORF Transcript_38170/g.90634 Transcript_38170/m.90634 type:complete len:232 (+) Transcript_38170:351-1046(+)
MKPFTPYLFIGRKRANPAEYLGDFPEYRERWCELQAVWIEEIPVRNTFKFHFKDLSHVEFFYELIALWDARFSQELLEEFPSMLQYLAKDIRIHYRTDFSSEFIIDVVHCEYYWPRILRPEVVPAVAGAVYSTEFTWPEHSKLAEILLGSSLVSVTSVEVKFSPASRLLVEAVRSQPLAAVRIQRAHRRCRARVKLKLLAGKVALLLEVLRSVPNHVAMLVLRRTFQSDQW